MRATEQIARERAAWLAKPSLRQVYADYFRRIRAALRTGRTLEVGGGSGNFKEFAPDVVAMDIQSAPWLDLAADVHALPFADGAFANVVMVDVLHHFSRPRAALNEAARVVRSGGRIVLLEPAITPGSWPFYRWFHREPVRLDDDPLSEEPLWRERNPYAANQAIPTLMFARHPERFAQAFPSLSIAERTWLSLLAYPLSGGFQPWNLLPKAAVAPLLAFEDQVLPWLGRLAGFRLLVVLDKRNVTTAGAI